MPTPRIFQSCAATVNRFFSDDTGATAIEYGLIATLITIPLIVGVTALNGSMMAMYGTIENAIGGALN